MATIRPFKGLHPKDEYAERVAALPYDVFSAEEAREEAQDNPLSFLNVDRAEITMPVGTDPHDPAVYDKARENFETLKEKALVQDETPCLYLYGLEMDGRRQIGLVCTTLVDEYLDGTIKTHEKTRADKERDRINHVNALDAQTGPIFQIYPHSDKVDKCISSIIEKKPNVDFKADDNIRHTVWKIEDPKLIDQLIEAFKEVENFYIADGHHRSKAAVEVSLMRRKTEESNSKAEHNYFLSVLFPDRDLYIMDYNRVVADLNGLTKEEFLKQVEKNFHIKPVEEAYKPKSKGEFGMYLDDQWYCLKYKGKIDKSDPIASLDVSILQDYLLSPILGIGDPRVDKRIDFIGGIRGLEELERRVHRDMTVAFSVYPTSTDELFAIADSGLNMPPKSTWFEPKLRSGLFIHLLNN